MARSATFESISEEVVVMRVSLLVWRSRITSARRLNQSQRSKPSIKLWRKLGDSTGIFLAGARGVGIFEVAPALVGAAGTRGNGQQLCRTDDVDPAVLTVFEPEDLLAGETA